MLGNFLEKGWKEIFLHFAQKASTESPEKREKLLPFLARLTHIVNERLCFILVRVALAHRIRNDRFTMFKVNMAQKFSLHSCTIRILI